MTNSDPDDKDNFPLFVFGNKSDLTADQSIRKEKVEDWCNEYESCRYYEMSARSNEGVEQGFIDLISKGLAAESRRVVGKAARKPGRTVNIRSKPAESQSSCCG